MLTNNQLIEGFAVELSIIRHLATKIEPGMLDYRPSEKQRSMLELLNYLGHIIGVGIENAIGGGKIYMELAKNAPVVTLENFDAVMQAQEASVREKLGALTDEDYAREVEVFGFTAPLVIHIMNVMKWSVAYKMQLFLYIKANGRHEINTSNLWRGVDPAPKE